MADEWTKLLGFLTDEETKAADAILGSYTVARRWLFDDFFKRSLGSMDIRIEDEKGQRYAKIDIPEWNGRWGYRLDGRAAEMFADDGTLNRLGLNVGKAWRRWGSPHRLAWEDHHKKHPRDQPF
jgi:hypothetical protein